MDYHITLDDDAHPWRDAWLEHCDEEYRIREAEWCHFFASHGVHNPDAVGWLVAQNTTEGPRTGSDSFFILDGEVPQ